MAPSTGLLCVMACYTTPIGFIHYIIARFERYQLMNIFQVKVLKSTPEPQRVIYAAMHQDYSDSYVGAEWADLPPEQECGPKIVRHLLAGGRGHYGPLEHPQIALAFGGFPHSTMQQIRTHRIGVSFDCRSFRYASRVLCEVAAQLTQGRTADYCPGWWNLPDRCKDLVESVVYIRPVGEYRDRHGNTYFYNQSARYGDLALAAHLIEEYGRRIQEGQPEEQARSLIAFDVRQHWVMSANVRSLLHLLDLRWKADAQLEAQKMCDLIWPHFEDWVPAIAAWYYRHRAHKAKLAP
jgi:thymidylate synthase (FAD)